jgi:Ser/Thr protein kinase RdoA (MazF antagonist)
MAALREAGIHTPQSLPGRDGEHLQTVSTAALGERSVALFCWIPGDFPSEDELEPSMFRLGELSARMHAQSRVWQRPAYFERLSWDHAGTIGPKAHWGRWDRSPGLTMEHQAVLRDTEALLCARLDVFGRGPDRFGLIHADQRIANLLVDGDTTHIIDFDDCGLGWFLHDLGAALSFIEHRPDCDRLVGRWAEGYARIGTLSAAEVAEFPSFVMQRRLQLLAWRGSHHETDLARSLDQEWVSATARMGAEYLRSMG